MFSEIGTFPSCLITVFPYLAFILLILSIIFLYYSFYRLNTMFSRIPLRNYIEATTSNAIPKLMSKWFDWLKFVIIIGTFSAINIKFPDLYITLVLYISYLAIFLDFLLFTYNLFYEIFYIPTVEFTQKFDPLIYEMKDLSNLARRLPEDITLYVPTSSLTKNDQKKREMKTTLDDADVINKTFIKTLNEINRGAKYASVIAAIFITYNLYILIDHIINLLAVSQLP